jgi:hypothetical protein
MASSAIVTKLYNSAVKVDGKESRFLNDLEVLDEETIVVSDSSVNYSRRDYAAAIVENAPSGR